MVNEAATTSATHELATAVRRARGERPASVAVVERTMGAGAMPALHVHAADEVFTVLDGSMTVHAGDETACLEAGQTFVARGGVPHTYRAGSKRVRYLAASVVRSARDYEDFLLAVSRPSSGDTDGLAESWPSTHEAAALARMARGNGIRVLGPPGMLPADPGRPTPAAKGAP
jgi:quercetin dioxygenase-like cupin family protein